MFRRHGSDLGQARAHAPERGRRNDRRARFALVVPPIEDDPFGRGARVHGHDLGAGQGLHVTGTAAHLD